MIDYLLRRHYYEIASLDFIGPDYLDVESDNPVDLAEDLTSLIESLDKTLSGYWIYAKYEIIALPSDDDEDSATHA